MKNLTSDDAVNIARIGVEFGRVVADARIYPMDVAKRNRLLEEMRPYKAIFEPIVQASVEELNRVQPKLGGSPRFDYQIE